MAAIVAVFGGGAIALQWLDSGPNVVARYGHLLPVWAHDPKVRGIAVTVLITALVIALILAPWKREQPQRSQTFNTIDGWIVQEMQLCLHHIRSAAKTGGIDAVNKEVLAALNHGIPTFLESAMSMSARRQFESAVQGARDGGITDPFALFSVATSCLGGMIAKEVTTRSANQQALKIAAPGRNPPLE
jgi:hypothetical protein